MLILSVGPAATVPAASDLHTKASLLYFLKGQVRAPFGRPSKHQCFGRNHRWRHSAPSWQLLLLALREQGGPVVPFGPPGSLFAVASTVAKSQRGGGAAAPTEDAVMKSVPAAVDELFKRSRRACHAVGTRGNDRSSSLRSLDHHVGGPRPGGVGSSQLTGAACACLERSWAMMRRSG